MIYGGRSVVVSARLPVEQKVGVQFPSTTLAEMNSWEYILSKCDPLTKTFCSAFMPHPAVQVRSLRNFDMPFDSAMGY
jgi:hypothetical protein